MKKNNIEFAYEGIDFNLPNEASIQTWIRKAVALEEKKIKKVTFIFCNDVFLLDINVKFLNHDYYTDVITFPYHKQNQDLWGDIFISVDRVKENATIHETEFIDELHRVMIHGILHLIGFNDITELDKKAMNLKENYHLKHLTP